MKYNIVIPAAGAATRLRPLSSNTSKVMVRVNGKPCLDYIIEYAKKSGEVEQVVIVDGKLDDIREYVSRKYSKQNVVCVKQESLNGPHDAICKGLSIVKDKSLPCLIWLGDAIITENNLPIGESFLLTKVVTDQSKWCMWVPGTTEYYNKPASNVNGAVALVGLYGFNTTDAAVQAFTQSEGQYDISFALQLHGNFKNVETNKWFDIGETHTYYDTCAKLMHLKAREFNNFRFNSDLKTITKFPTYSRKESIETIESERSWYTNLTVEQKCFTPRIMENKNHTEIVMSYESGTLLSDLLLYDNISESTWSYILDKVVDTVLKYFHSQEPHNGFVDRFYANAQRMWKTKSEERIVSIKELYDLLTVKEFENIVSNILSNIRPVGTMHGDLHFGNILYDTNIDKITFIDPRGKYGSDVTVSGDNIYDFAKLAHDLYFGYNAIVANATHPPFIRDLFVKKLEERNLPTNTIIAAGWLLLLTCIPLHYDCEAKQQRMIKEITKWKSTVLSLI